MSNLLYRTELNRLIEKIISVLEQLLQSFKLGNVLKNGVATAIIGQPNAGKSTLLNTLLNDDRAIVSDIAGTTRDTIEEMFVLDGIAFRLIDTAGIRDTTDNIEAIGVRKAYEKAQQAQLILYVFDAASIKAENVIQDVESLMREDVSIILCGNKMDLLSDDEKSAWLDALMPLTQGHALDFIGISAKEQTNLAALQYILSSTVMHRGEAVGNTIVSNARHAAALQNALDYLNAARNGLQNQVSSDWVAMDIRRSIHELGLVVGEVSTDDLLDKIFRDFCIGK